MIREVAGWLDSDWFAAELTADTSYVIEILSASTEGCTLRAPVLEGIHNASGTLIAGTEWSNANRGNTYTELTFTPDTGGTHYIAVTAEANLLGTYIVALTAGGDGSADRITAIGEQGCFPAAPRGLGTSGIAHNSVTLSWTAPDATGITGYQVLRGTSAASLSAIVADTGSTATTYTDSSAAASTTYHYAVAAITAAGPGLLSITAMTSTDAKPPKNPNTPRANTPPGSTGLTLSPSFDRVTLTWSVVTGTVSGHKIWRGTAADSLTVLVANTGSTDTSYVDETAAAETEYHYAVAAINSHGTGPKSTASTTTLAAPVVNVLEPLIAAQQQEAEIVTFVTNLGQGPGDRTTITTSTVTGRATHDQGFTTGSDNSLFPPRKPRGPSPCKFRLPGRVDLDRQQRQHRRHALRPWAGYRHRQRLLGRRRLPVAGHQILGPVRSPGIHAFRRDRTDGKDCGSVWRRPRRRRQRRALRMDDRRARQGFTQGKSDRPRRLSLTTPRPLSPTSTISRQPPLTPETLHQPHSRSRQGPRAVHSHRLQPR